MAASSQSVSILGVVVRDIARLNRVTRIVSRHGFGELLRASPLARFVAKEEALPESDEALRSTPKAIRFRRLLEALGPTYVKLGQILSMRGDVLPADYVLALQKLQDDTPRVPFEDIRAVIEAGLGLPIADLFSEFDETPLATASIAQTHLARTLGGERVVVKVQRPGIEQVMRGDLDLLYLGAKILEATIDEMQIYAPSEIAVEFERALVRELDFRSELENLLTARRFLDPARKITVPKPHPDLTCKTVLTMEYFAGIPLRKLEPGSARAKRAVEELLHAACKQVVHDGFFHGDPHPGNILINEDDVICMIDFGLAGTLSASQRDDLVTLVLAVMMNDTAGIARVLLKMGTPTQRINMSDLKAEIARIRSTHLTVKSITEHDSGAFAQEFAAAASRFSIKLAPEYTVLSKAGATIEGIVRTLAPDVDIVAIARPYAEAIIKDRYAPQKLLSEAMSGIGDVGNIVRQLPGQLDQVLHDMESGNLQVRTVSAGIDDIGPMLRQLGSRVSLSAFAAVMTLCAAILLSAPEPRWLLAIGCIGASVIAWSTLWVWHFIGRGKRVRLQPLLKFFSR